MTDLPDPLSHVISLIPQDPKLQRAANEGLPRSQQWHPSIEHSPTTCDQCGRACWIGPKQKELYESVFVKYLKVCAICIIMSSDDLGADFTYHALNPNEGDIPRRT